MSMLGKEVADFSVQAFVNGEFKTVTKRMFWAIGAYFSSIRRILLLYVLRNWKTCRTNMRILRLRAARFIPFPVIPILSTKHGMTIPNGLARLPILCWPILPTSCPGILMY